jgi:gamma-glutamyltranspeptidase/glutathione hydrolase
VVDSGTYRATDGHEVVVDGRETALAAHDMYLDANGDAVPGRSVDGALAAAIPVSGRAAHIARHYGRSPWRNRSHWRSGWRGGLLSNAPSKLARPRLVALQNDDAAPDFLT